VDEGTDAFDDDGDGFTEASGDCDDADDTVHPGASDPEGGADQDCDGADEGDVDRDGFTTEDGDCDDADGWAHPDGTEFCDGVDNDCDGELDEGDVCIEGFGGDDEKGCGCETRG